MRRCATSIDGNGNVQLDIGSGMMPATLLRHFKEDVPAGAYLSSTIVHVVLCIILVAFLEVAISCEF